MNREKAIELLNARTSRYRREGVPLPGHNPNTTRIVWDDDGNPAIKLHSTNVVVWLSDGRIKLSTGGYPSMTTRARIEAADEVAAVVGKTASGWSGWSRTGKHNSRECLETWGVALKKDVDAVCGALMREAERKGEPCESHWRFWHDACARVVIPFEDNMVCDA